MYEENQFKNTQTIFNNIIEKYYTDLMKETPIKVLTVYKTQNRQDHKKTNKQKHVKDTL